MRGNTSDSQKGGEMPDMTAMLSAFTMYIEMDEA